MKRFVIVLGTKNRHKVREIMAICRLWRTLPPDGHLDGAGRLAGKKPVIRFIPLTKFPNIPEVKENGSTYLANATKKAITWAKYTGLPTLAEDSGLEVKELNWQPGLHSARFASNSRHKNASDTENVRKLLGELSGLPQAKRTARYRCAAVLASPSGKIIARAQGACSGRITLKPAGRNGFGYDPVFIPDMPNSQFTIRHSQLATFGQLPASLKHRISHRGIALRKIFSKLSKIIDTP